MSASSPNRGERLAEAEARLTEGDLDGARGILVDLVRRFPDDDVALAELDRLIAVVESGPEAPTYFKSLAAARVARDSGDRAVAIRLLARAREIWDGDPAIRDLAEELAREPEPPPRVEPEPAPEPEAPPRRRRRWVPIAAAGALLAAVGAGTLLVSRRPPSPAPEPVATPVSPASPSGAGTVTPPERPSRPGGEPIREVKTPREASAPPGPPVPPPERRSVAELPKADPRWEALAASARELDRRSPANAAEADAILARAQALTRDLEGLPAAGAAGAAPGIRQTLERIVRGVSRLKEEFVANEESAAAARSEQARSGIRAAVEAWRRAQEDLDAAALRRVLPALDEKVQANLYKSIAWQKVELRDEAIEIAPEGDRATASYAMRLTIQAKKAESPVVRDVRVDAQLVREGAGWIIRRTDFRK